MQSKIINYCKILLVCLVLASCGKSREDKFIKEVTASLNAVNLITTSQTKNSLTILHLSLEKPETRDKATFYYPKADTIHQTSDALIAYIDSLNNKSSRTNYFLNEQEIKQVYKKLIDYKNRVFMINERMKSELADVLKVTIDTKDDNELSEKQFINSFKAIPHKIKLAILISRILKINSFCADWFCKNASYTCGGVYDRFQAIAAQNSTHFKPNEMLEITAGMGIFSKATMPLITIDGKPILLNPEGVAEYKTKVAAKKGKFSKLVKIEYRKPDGTTGSVEKEIRYTVDE